MIVCVSVHRSHSPIISVHTSCMLQLQTLRNIVTCFIQLFLFRSFVILSALFRVFHSGRASFLGPKLVSQLTILILRELFHSLLPTRTSIESLRRETVDGVIIVGHVFRLLIPRMHQFFMYMFRHQFHVQFPFALSNYSISTLSNGWSIKRRTRRSQRTADRAIRYTPAATTATEYIFCRK